MEVSNENYVDLGFAEEQDSWLLTNRYFPSKIGGRVAWLELENIPDSDMLNCEYCNETCIFLCQIYAPSEKNLNAFHRTIYVFVCKNGKCCTSNSSGNFKVLRSQLPVKNKFYPDTPPDESVQAEEIETLCKLCNVCGCKAPMICGKCKKVNYCGQLHQKIDWKNHKKTCGQDSQVKSENHFIFPEYEIVIEREVIGTEKSKESEKDAENRRIKEYEDMVKKGKFGDTNDISEKDLEEIKESKEDKAFGRFKKTIERYPTQVIRYNRHGAPLWISSNGILSKNVPNCLNCNRKRTFEFQIMPQMLNELKNYDLDWGVVTIFTCENDCDTNGQYIQEFCYKQDITKNDEIDFCDIDKMNIEEEKNPDTKEQTKNPQHTKENSSFKKTSKKKNGSSHAQKVAFTESDNWE